MQRTHHVKLLLKFFISVVNTELLKAVYFKCFKPGHTKHMIYYINSCTTLPVTIQI